MRVTQANGTPFEDRHIGPRRKKVTKSWWNKQWLARTIGVMQFLREDQNSDCIDIGAGRRKVSVGIHPLSWDCPVAVDVEAVDKIGDLHEEMAAIRYVVDNEEDSNET